jgi:hypothetical protein
VLARIAHVPIGRTHFAAALGRKDKSASLVAEPASRDQLRGAGLRTGRIDVGGVEEVDARIGCPIEHAMGFRLVRLFSERTGAEDHSGNRQA